MTKQEEQAIARAVREWLNDNRKAVLEAISLGVCDWMNAHPVSSTEAIEAGTSEALSGRVT